MHSQHCYLIRQLYKRALKTNFDYNALERKLYRQGSIIIRQRFEAHRHESDPKKIRELVDFTENLLEDLKHPEPAIPPFEPGGTAYQTNYVPPPDYMAGSGVMEDVEVDYKKKEKDFKFPL